MASSFSSMDFNTYPSSPSASPSNTIFSNGNYFDSTSDSSSPSSPHVNQMMFNSPLPFDIFQYNVTQANFYPSNSDGKMSTEATGSSMDDKDRRRRRSDDSRGAGKEGVTHMHLRRRAQNRASQRAFRERKEKHVKGLEHQLENLHEKHQDLLQSYSKSIEEVTRLNSRIADLAAELHAVRNCQDSSFGSMMISDEFDKFDAFSATQVAYDPTNSYYDKGPNDISPELFSNAFEDSL